MTSIAAPLRTRPHPGTDAPIGVTALVALLFLGAATAALVLDASRAVVVAVVIANLVAITTQAVHNHHVHRSAH